MKRIELVGIEGVGTSYFTRFTKKRLDVKSFGKSASVCPDFCDALHKLDQEVKSKGGNFYISDLTRDYVAQEKARWEYITGKKKAFVAKPGESFHNAGRAVDIDIESLNFSNIKKLDWIKKLWDLAIPLGFRSVIKEPIFGISECWHLDYIGVWTDALNVLSYSEVAKCAVLDVGMWNSKEDSAKTIKMFIQSQLIRLKHYEIGEIDGVIGKKTINALNLYDIEDYMHLENIAEILKNK